MKKKLWKNIFSYGISYDEYINRWYGNYFNIFGQVKSKNSNKNRMISSVMFYEKEKQEYKKNLDKKNKENQVLKNLIAELCIKNNLDKNIYEGLSKEGIDIINSISKENGGKITLNDEGTEYIFKKTKNMFEGIVKDNINEENNENKIEDKKENIEENNEENNNDENIENKNENKIDKEEQNKKNLEMLKYKIFGT